MFKSFCVVASFLLVSPSVTAEIFKCVRQGKVVYQNFSCELETIGSQATASPEQAAPASPTTIARPARAAAQPPKADPSDEETSTVNSSAAASQKQPPRAGMTPRQVRRLSWGEPADIAYQETPEGRIQTWTYPDKRTIRFDKNGRVASFEQ
jgi:hypothetical protein